MWSLKASAKLKSEIYASGLPPNNFLSCKWFEIAFFYYVVNITMEAWLIFPQMSSNTDILCIVMLPFEMNRDDARWQLCKANIWSGLHWRFCKYFVLTLGWWMLWADCLRYRYWFPFSLSRYSLKTHVNQSRELENHRQICYRYLMSSAVKTERIESWAAER